MLDPETRGERAAEILDSEVYQEAVAGAKQRIKDEWGHSKDERTRNDLWHKLQAIEAVTIELKTIRDGGVMARSKREKETGRE